MLPSAYLLRLPVSFSLCPKRIREKRLEQEINRALANKNRNLVSNRKFLVDCSFDNRYVTSLLVVEMLFPNWLLDRFNN